MCPEAKARLQEGFDWWAEHVQTHGCLACTVARAALMINRAAMGMVSRLGLHL